MLSILIQGLKQADIDIDVDSRMSPDLPRGTSKSIGGDLNVNDEGSEQRRFEPVQLLHHGSVWLPTHAHTNWPRQEGYVSASESIT
jgi:hypothetical protein